MTVAIVLVGVTDTVKGAFVGSVELGLVDPEVLLNIKAPP